MVSVATATTLRLNGFRLEPSTESFTAYRAPMPPDGDLRELRRSLESTWTIYREHDEIHADDFVTFFGEAAGGNRADIAQAHDADLHLCSAPRIESGDERLG